MNIQDLEDKHNNISDATFLAEIEHTKLSIQFAINILGEMLISVSTNGNQIPSKEELKVYDFINNKIEELKKYL